jgi:hypothetical protein
VTGSALTSPTGAVTVPKCGDRDYREAAPSSQGKNTRSWGFLVSDTIMLIFSNLRQLQCDSYSGELDDSAFLLMRIDNDTVASLSRVQRDLRHFVFTLIEDNTFTRSSS